MFDGMHMDRFDGEYSLSFDCGDTPVDHVVVAMGDEPNGHFWESVATYVAPRPVSHLKLDSEGSMFSASGKRRHLRKLRAELEPLLSDSDRLREVLDEARARGHVIEG